MPSGNDLDLISLRWGLACHRVGSELQGSMQGEAQLVARGEGGRSEWRVCLKSLGRETESKPKSQTWGQWHAANLWGDRIRGWVESNDRAELWSRGHDSLRMQRALPPTPLSTGHSHGSPPRATLWPWLRELVNQGPLKATHLTPRCLYCAPGDW